MTNRRDFDGFDEEFDELSVLIPVKSLNRLKIVDKKPVAHRTGACIETSVEKAEFSRKEKERMKNKKKRRIENEYPQ